MSDLDRRIKLEALITRREGMIAENEYRAQFDHMGVAYTEDSFFCIEREILELLEVEL